MQILNQIFNVIFFDISVFLFGQKYHNLPPFLQSLMFLSSLFNFVKKFENIILKI